MRARLSLTARLTALFTLTSVVVLVGLGVIVASAIDRHFKELDRYTLQDKVMLVQRIATQSASLDDLRARLDDVLYSHEGLSVQLARGGDPLYANANGGFRFPERPPQASGTAEPQGVVAWHEGVHEYRSLRAEVRAPRLADGPLQMQVALDTRHHMHFMTDLLGSLTLYLGLATAVSCLLGWWVARSGLAPLRAMKARAQAVTAHKLDQRMPVESVPVELADLAVTLNEMLTRLQADFQRLSDFSSDLAHELRTPINNLMTETQVSLSQPRSAQEYREILESNAEEFQRLARIVSDMLFLAKAEHGLVLPSREPIDVREEALALCDFYEALAEERGVRLEVAGDGRIEGDRLMLRRALSNLLSNALRYTPRGGRTVVEVAAQGADTCVSVENTGPEIPSDFLPRVFDRFARADKARSHGDADGAGLGLAITRAIAVAHGGQISAESAGGRTRFTLRFPGRP